MKQTHYIITLLAASALTGSAATLNVSNGTFTGNLAGWGITEVATGANPDSIYYYLNTTAFKDGTGGLDAVGSEVNYIQQNLTTTNAGLSTTTYGEYTVQLDFGWRGTSADAIFRVSLINLGDSSATLDSVDYLLTAGSSDTDVAFNLTYDTGSAIAGDVALRIARVDADATPTNNTNYFSTARVDNVRVDANVAAAPEPSSTALLGLGGLALILRRRK